jgi:hypothetical protein
MSAVAIDFDVVITPDGSSWVEFSSADDLARVTATRGDWVASHICKVIAMPVALASVLADALITFVLRRRERSK